MNQQRTTLNVLIACEESQAECFAFRQLGHDAYSCDIQKCRRGGNPDWHIQADVTPYLAGETSFVTQSGLMCTVESWDLIIAHPPCTYLCKFGSSWLYHNPDKFVLIDEEVRHVNARRLQQMREGREFFFKCLQAKAKFVAVENPIPMRLAQLPPPSFFVCPSWYGYKYSKKTLYWTKNLPPLFAEYITPNPKQLVRSSRGKYRSRTSPELAEAIAKQWSEFILAEI